jgi:hypothetical protein
MGGTRLERVLTRADHVDLVIGRVYSSFHSVPFRGNFILTRQAPVSRSVAHGGFVLIT